MNREEAIAAACEHCVDAASMLAGVSLGVDADTDAMAHALAASVVCGWSDLASSGTADARGIVVQPKGESIAYRVRWSEVAAWVGPALRAPGIAERLDEVYERYVEAATGTSVSHRLAARVASAELAQARRQVLDLAAHRMPVQQSLFADPPVRGRSLAR
jgi:hypothetical protein